MAISFNNIPTSIRTPNAYVEIDNSRALKGLVQNPHRVLIIGQRIATAEGAPHDALVAITRDNLADGFFGPGSVAARMCNKFKQNNPNTELHAIAIGSGDAGVKAGCMIDFSGVVISTDGVSGGGPLFMMINGTQIPYTITSNDSSGDITLGLISIINSMIDLPVEAAQGGAANISGELHLSAKCSGTLGNYIDVRFNYYDGQSSPSHLFAIASVSTLHSTSMTLGANDPDLGDVWAVIGGEQFHYIIQPWTDTPNLVELEEELADRFLPLEDLQGHGFTAVNYSNTSCTALGNARNSPHNTIVGMHKSPTCPEEWAAAWGAVAAWNLNIDPARPLHFLKLKGIMPPKIENRWNRAERDVLLYDGIATWFTDPGGSVVIERSITTYRENAVGLPDPSYLDIQTLATLGEIRYQYKVRMTNRFIVPRFKLADDTFPAQPGSKVARPKDVFAETVALFTLLRDRGLIENLDEFINNLVVERDDTDRNRVNTLLPADIINQFRILAGNIQFIL